MLSFKLKKQTNKNVADTTFNRNTTAVLTGRDEVDTFCILNFVCLFFLFAINVIRNQELLNAK